MTDMTIYHNPRCSKSRQALDLLRARGIAPVIILYLEDTPSAGMLADLLQKLGKSASEILRRGEPEYKAHFKGIEDEASLLALMARYPKVIERPIVERGDRAVIGRPPEAVLALLAEGLG